MQDLRGSEPVSYTHLDVYKRQEEGKVEGKVGISFIGVGGKSQEGRSTSNESRVKFSIPVCLPVTDIIRK